MELEQIISMTIGLFATCMMIIIYVIGIKD